jgi:nucleoside-diphosphate-sugar epimerase
LIWDLFKELSQPGEIAWLDGTGSESRDFLHIDDVAEAVFQLAEWFAGSPAGSFEVINIASGAETAIAALAGQIRDLVAPDKDLRCRGNSRPGDPLNWCGEISKLRAIVPLWKPRPMIDALNDCVTTWRQELSVFQHGA